MRLVRSLLCVSLVCVSSLSVVSIAHANQVQPAPPPLPPAAPPAPNTPAPPPAPEAEQAPPAPEPAPAVAEEPAPTVVDQPPPPPPAPPPTTDAQATVAIGVDASMSDPDTSRAETHEGFFLRLALGLGMQAWSKQLPSDPPDDVGLPVGGGEATFGGLGLSLEIAIGAVVTDNLALHVTMFGAGLGEPTLSVADRDLPNAKGRAFAASLLGVGATYYFMPANIYVSASFGLGGMRMVPKDGAKAIDTKAGLAWELLAGKEWWVSDEWGLGAALQVAYVNVPDEGERSAALVVNALFSATYN